MNCATKIAATILGGEESAAVVVKKGAAARRLRSDSNLKALRKSVRFFIPIERELLAPVIEVNDDAFKVSPPPFQGARSRAQLYATAMATAEG